MINSWMRAINFTQLSFVTSALVVVRKPKGDSHPPKATCEDGISHLSKVVGSLSAASTRRQGLRQQPNQSLKRLGALDFRAARMRTPANTSETRQVIDECSWQTSRVKPVLATLESVSEAPLGEHTVKNTKP